MTKEQFRAELGQQARSFVERDGGEVVLYAAQRKPDRQPWRKKPSVLDEAQKIANQRNVET